MDTLIHFLSLLSFRSPDEVAVWSQSSSREVGTRWCCFFLYRKRIVSLYLKILVFTHLIASESISWIVYTKILKEGCGEEDMSSFELFMISLSHENIFQKPLAGVFRQILNWIGPGALILWDITILWHAADSSPFLQRLFSSGENAGRTVCLSANTPPC